MNNLKTICILAVCLSFISACNFSVYSGERSGTVSDDFIEEPIKERSLKYKRALTISNSVIEKIREGKYNDIESLYIRDDMKKALAADVIKLLIDGAIDAMGPIKGYKKMQWGFVPAEENGVDLLFSFKIVQHENGALNYAFVFQDDKKYQKLVGLVIKPRTGTRAPNEL